jgi:hypothetical protein
LKSASLLLAIALVGASAMQSGFAKAHHAHRAAAKGDGVATAQPSIAKDANPSASQAKDASDAAVGAEPSPAGVTADKAGRATINAKSAAPASYQVRRLAVPGPSDTVPRNSIGVAVAPQKSATADRGENLKAAAPAPVAAARGFADHFGDHDAMSLPVATASIPNRGKIDGTDLIRPSVAPSGLGGPAKALAGINGTTLRPKH